MGKMTNNKAVISGMVINEPEYLYEGRKGEFSLIYIECTRLSGRNDIIPVIVSENLLEGNPLHAGDLILVDGRVNVYHDNKSGHMYPRILADKILPYGGADENYIWMEGILREKPNYKVTPTGRHLSNFLLYVKRPKLYSHTVPCLAWGTNADFIESMKYGSSFEVEGRFQSREYKKSGEWKTAYEVSLAKITLVEEMDENSNAKKNETGEL